MPTRLGRGQYGDDLAPPRLAKIGMLEKRETIAAAEWRTEDRTTRWTQR
ncbi:hypothetical protein [Candidatus Mycolicibacterium alkanivorans]|uniref:Uncharacterized protein n=1 Tax=Candidatus Mycolicibacterium alkanivorans TaxID=2954114 RepID=A0ABS9YTV0_9MYCO|nr:hypothetical protein [Candidatus Mycolicibacterium alkanivorans]MCI4674665.1 hypothetical protein [Candidatus Mycolicibacterium alkanivorans]